jgi:hypothetical protein
MIDRKTSFFTGIIAVLVVIILLQRACSGPAKTTPCDSTSTTLIKTDTVYRDVVKTDIKKVKVFLHDTTYVKETWMVADSNYGKLKHQFEDLVDLYASRNIYRDTINIDTIGNLVVIDTITHNNLRLRTYNHNYKIPTITNTVVVPAPPKRQMYIGGALGFGYPITPTSIQAGFLFKDKKDQIYGLHAGIDMNGNITYLLSSYWKISFNK